MTGLLACGWTVAAVWGSIPAWAGEDIPAEKVPQKVVEAFKAKYPKAQITEIQKNEPGSRSYEFHCKEGEKIWKAKFSDDAKLTEVEERLKEADLPQPVKDGFAKKYPKMTMYRVEKEINVTVQPNKFDFKITFTTAEGKKKQAKFTPAGEFLKEKDKEK